MSTKYKIVLYGVGRYVMEPYRKLEFILEEVPDFRKFIDSIERKDSKEVYSDSIKYRVSTYVLPKFIAEKDRIGKLVEWEKKDINRLELMKYLAKTKAIYDSNEDEINNMKHELLKTGDYYDYINELVISLRFIANVVLDILDNDNAYIDIWEDISKS